MSSVVVTYSGHYRPLSRKKKGGGEIKDEPLDFADRLRLIFLNAGFGRVVTDKEGKQRYRWRLKQIEAATGVSRNTFKRILYDFDGSAGCLDHINAKKITTVVGCDIRWLFHADAPYRLLPAGVDLNGNGTPHPVEAAEPGDGAVTIPTDTMVFVPVLRSELLKDGDAYYVGNYETRWFGFPRSFVRELTEDENALRLIRCRDDGMVPLLRPGDSVLVDTGRCHVVEDGGVYAFFLGPVLHVAELKQESGSDRVMIIPHNPVYSTFDVARNAIQILGRCVWYARSLL